MEPSLPFEFDIRSAAFVIVDLQNDFVRSDALLGAPDALRTLEPASQAERECVAVADELDPQLHETTLKNLGMKFSAVITSEELTALVG